MSLRPLVLGTDEHADIARVLAYAREHPVTQHDLFRIMAHPEQAPGNTPERVCTLPLGYRCAFTLEHQPPGLCRHLSMCVLPLRQGDKPELPGPAAVALLAKAFGIDQPDKIWVEEIPFKEEGTGHFQALNLIQVIRPS